MAENTAYTPLPADLPEDWTVGQTVAPAGADVGLSQQHGYNYLNAQVNAAQRAANQLHENVNAIHALPAGGTAGQLLGKTGPADGQAGWQNPPVLVKILETICENVTVDDANPSITFSEPIDIPIPITLGEFERYLLIYTYYRNGEFDDSNSGYMYARVWNINGEAVVRWITDDNEDNVTLTSSGVVDTYRSSGNSAVISIYKVEIVQANKLDFSALQTYGYKSFAAGLFSLAEGRACEAQGEYSHAEGDRSTSSGYASHAEGLSNASGSYSHSEGSSSAMGAYSHAGGYGCRAGEDYQTAIGKHNKFSYSEADRLIIGKGIDSANRANCFRATDTGVYASGSYNASGADYAELFEWLDGNPDRQDRAGLFVTLQGDKIRLAAPGDDYILGIVSAAPSVVGDVYDDQWAGMYLTDIFGRPVYEDVDLPAELGPGGEELLPERTEHRQKLNPAYDNTAQYLPRTQRPEWDAVGLLGKLVVVDDGTCVPDGWCAVGEGGRATRSGERTRYRVMARLDESHIRVMILP